jgi:hypothetical protein
MLKRSTDRMPDPKARPTYRSNTINARSLLIDGSLYVVQFVK